jgi:hypothetical protein
MYLDTVSKTTFVPAYLWSPFSNDFDEFMDKLADEEKMIDLDWKEWTYFLEDNFWGLTTVGSEEREIDFDRTELSLKFAKLKTDKDIEKFAQSYGLLGISPPNKRVVFKNNEVQDFSSVVQSLNFGSSYFEPLLIWKWHIQNVQRLLKLYKALLRDKNGKEANIEGDLLWIKEITLPATAEKYRVFWSDGEYTNVDINHPEKLTFVEIGRLVLVKSITNQLDGAVNIEPREIIDNDKNKIGFHIPETRATKYLKAAIYYDLWQRVNENTQITFCENPECRLPIKKSGRTRHCNDACKQAAYRARKGK